MVSIVSGCAGCTPGGLLPPASNVGWLLSPPLSFSFTQPRALPPLLHLFAPSLAPVLLWVSV